MLLNLEYSELVVGEESFEASSFELVYVWDLENFERTHYRACCEICQTHIYLPHYTSLTAKVRGERVEE